jgi:acetyl esterase
MLKEELMALDAAPTAFLAALARARGKPLHEITPAEARGLGAALKELYRPGPEMAPVVDHQVPTAAGGSVAIRVHELVLGPLRPRGRPPR